jgi:DNA-directed RNA polymerase specialized sigma24 family protein
LGNAKDIYQQGLNGITHRRARSGKPENLKTLLYKVALKKIKDEKKKASKPDLPNQKIQPVHRKRARWP